MPVGRLSEYEHALAQDAVSWTGRKATMEVDYVPTESEFVEYCKTDEAKNLFLTPEHYEGFKKKRQDALAEKARKAAEEKAKRFVKLRVAGAAIDGVNKWKNGHPMSYLLPAQAPFKVLANGQVEMSKPEPGIRVPVGKVVLVPVRDDAHLAVLKSDVNIEMVDENAPTAEEEEAAKMAAVEALKKSKQQVSRR